MTFSVRRLFIATGLASYFFSLAYLTFFQRNLVFLISIIIIAMCKRNSARPVIYGVVIGITTIVAIAHILAKKNGEWPFVQTYEASSRFIEFARQFAFPIGGGVGAFIGFLFSESKKE